jgi:hypothetical protein
LMKNMTLAAVTAEGDSPEARLSRLLVRRGHRSRANMTCARIILAMVAMGYTVA